jgi:sulfur carrier protein
MQLKVNGQPREFPDELTLTEVVRALGLVPETILLEHNGLALLRHEWAQIAPQDGDRIEILRVVAGG